MPHLQRCQAGKAAERGRRDAAAAVDLQAGQRSQFRKVKLAHGRKPAHVVHLQRGQRRQRRHALQHAVSGVAVPHVNRQRLQLRQGLQPAALSLAAVSYGQLFQARGEGEQREVIFGVRCVRGQRDFPKASALRQQLLQAGGPSPARK